MLKVGMSKSEIEKEIEGKGTFVQIDWLSRFLKEPLTMDMKKFIFLKLAEVYERINMFKEAAKMYENMSGLSLTFVEKIKHHMKSVEAYIKAGDVAGSEEAMKKAMSEANTMQREEIYQQALRLYKTQAETFEKNNKRANAVPLYEKLLEMRISEIEKKEIKEKLHQLYENLGKIRELRSLERKF